MSHTVDSGKLPLNVCSIWNIAAKHARCMVSRLKYAINRMWYHVWYPSWTESTSSNFENGCDMKVPATDLNCVVIQSQFNVHHRWLLTTVCDIMSFLQVGSIRPTFFNLIYFFLFLQNNLSVIVSSSKLHAKIFMTRDSLVVSWSTCADFPE